MNLHALRTNPPNHRVDASTTAACGQKLDVPAAVYAVEHGWSAYFTTVTCPSCRVALDEGLERGEVTVDEDGAYHWVATA